ncbi:hypothetical protein MKX62_12375 [Sporosarcina sp. FSL K6-5500]
MNTLKTLLSGYLSSDVVLCKVNTNDIEGNKEHTENPVIKLKYLKMVKQAFEKKM